VMQTGPWSLRPASAAVAAHTKDGRCCMAHASECVLAIGFTEGSYEDNRADPDGWMFYEHIWWHRGHAGWRHLDKRADVGVLSPVECRHERLELRASRCIGRLRMRRCHDSRRSAHDAHLAGKCQLSGCSRTQLAGSYEHFRPASTSAQPVEAKPREQDRIWVVESGSTWSAI